MFLIVSKSKKKKNEMKWNELKWINLLKINFFRGNLKVLRSPAHDQLAAEMALGQAFARFTGYLINK